MLVQDGVPAGTMASRSKGHHASENVFESARVEPLLILGVQMKAGGDGSWPELGRLRTGRFREEFRAPAGVRKSPKHEPAGLRRCAMVISDFGVFFG
jgi:hypothetical protein